MVGKYRLSYEKHHVKFTPRAIDMLRNPIGFRSNSKCRFISE